MYKHSHLQRPAARMRQFRSASRLEGFGVLHWSASALRVDGGHAEVVVAARLQLASRVRQAVGGQVGHGGPGAEAYVMHLQQVACGGEWRT